MSRNQQAELPNWYRQTTGFQMGVIDERERATTALKTEIATYTDNPERLDSADARATLLGLRRALTLIETDNP